MGQESERLTKGCAEAFSCSSTSSDDRCRAFCRSSDNTTDLAASCIHNKLMRLTTSSVYSTKMMLDSSRGKHCRSQSMRTLPSTQSAYAAACQGVQIYKACKKLTGAVPEEYRQHVRKTGTGNSTSRDATAFQGYKQHIRKKSTNASQQRNHQNVYSKR